MPAGTPTSLQIPRTMRSARRAWTCSSRCESGTSANDARSASRPAASSRFHRATPVAGGDGAMASVASKGSLGSLRNRWRGGCACRQRQDLEGVFGNQYGVFPLRRQAMVGGDDRPAVGEAANARPPGIDHWLDREDHSRLQLQSSARAAVMQHLRFLVELAVDAVVAELAHHREAVALGEALDGCADVAQVRATLDFTNAAPHC